MFIKNKTNDNNLYLSPYTPSSSVSDFELFLWPFHICWTTLRILSNWIHQSYFISRVKSYLIACGKAY